MHVLHRILDVVLDLPEDVVDLLLRLDEDLQGRIVMSVTLRPGVDRWRSAVGGFARNHRHSAVQISGHNSAACGKQLKQRKT